MKRIALFAAAASLAMVGAAQAQTIATANTSVNIRSGPGPEHPVIGSIGANRRATIIGCVEGSMWCQVNFRGLQGWAYSQYMTLNPGTAREIVVTERAPMVTSMVPTVTYSAPAYRNAYAYGGPVYGTTTYRSPAYGNPTYGGTTYSSPTYAAPTYAAPTYAAPTYAAPVATYSPPVVSTIDSARGAYAMAPAATSITVTPPPAVGSYVVNNPLTPVTWPGQAVVGAALPRTVELQPVPNYRYQYVYVNDQPVLVDPITLRIVYVFP